MKPLKKANVIPLCVLWLCTLEGMSKIGDFRGDGEEIGQSGLMSWCWGPSNKHFLHVNQDEIVSSFALDSFLPAINMADLLLPRAHWAQAPHGSGTAWQKTSYFLWAPHLRCSSKMLSKSEELTETTVYCVPPSSNLSVGINFSSNVISKNSAVPAPWYFDATGTNTADSYIWDHEVNTGTMRAKSFNNSLNFA